MKKSILLSTSLLILAGCGTIKQYSQPIKTDKEPILVGIPLDERISRTGKTIDEQKELLNKVENKTHVGKYDVVEHNNLLDARKSSPQTLPQAYAKNTKIAGTPVTPPVIAPELQKTIKKIEWDDSSANELAENFAKALGYKIIINGDRDVNVTLNAENESIMSVINKFRTLIKDEALVVVSEQNKTIFIAYKNATKNSPQQ